MYEVYWYSTDGYEDFSDGHFLFDSLENAFHGMEVVFHHFQSDLEEWSAGDAFEMGAIHEWDGETASVSFSGRYAEYKITLSEAEILGADFSWDDSWDD